MPRAISPSGVPPVPQSAASANAGGVAAPDELPFRRAGSARPRERPARASGLGPRYSGQRASAQQTPMTARAPGPRGPRLDQRDRRSARHDVERPYVERAPAAFGHDRLRDRSGPQLPAEPPAARISPMGRRQPSPQRPDARLANPHGANHSVRQEIALAPLRPRSPRARTHGCRDVAVRRRRHARHQPPWRAAAESPAACGADYRSFQRTRRSAPALRQVPPALRHRLDVAPPPSRMCSSVRTRPSAHTPGGPPSLHRGRTGRLRAE